MVGSYVKITLITQTKLQFLFGVDASGCSRVQAFALCKGCLILVTAEGAFLLSLVSPVQGGA